MFWVFLLILLFGAMLVKIGSLSVWFLMMKWIIVVMAVVIIGSFLFGLARYLLKK